MLSLQQIKECCDKAVIVAKVPKTDCPSTAPSKLTRGDAVGSGKVMAVSSAKPVKRPATTGLPAPSKKTQQKRQPAGAAAAKAKSAKCSEKGLSEEEVDETAAAIFSQEIISGLSDTDWKTRLSAVEELTQVLHLKDTVVWDMTLCSLVNVYAYCTVTSLPPPPASYSSSCTQICVENLNSRFFF
jgi:cytoskeleton-associated protein 5